MRKLHAPWILLAGFMASALIVASRGQRKLDPPAPPLPLHDWDIPALVAHLNRAGLRLRIVNTQKDGSIQGTAFLTTTAKEWIEFNHLSKDRKQIDAWHGSVYCERLTSGRMHADLVHQWGDFGLSVGPFLFYGDPDLLDRVRAALLTGTIAA